METWPVDSAATAIIRPGGAPTLTLGDCNATFELASVTKVMFATAILVAIEEGSLQLAQPAGPKGATVAHLLAHASGLGPDGQRLTPPGTRRIYSNAGFEVLGRTLTDATGLTAPQYLAEAVLDPLAMSASELPGSPAHSAISTVNDIALLAATWLEPGGLLAASTVAEASGVWFPELDGVLPGYGAQDPNPWGLGVEVRGHKRPHWTGSHNSASTFGHFGQGGSFLWIDPVLGAGLVVLTNRPFGNWATFRWPTLSDTVVDAIQLSEGVSASSTMPIVTLPRR